MFQDIKPKRSLREVLPQKHKVKKEFQELVEPARRKLTRTKIIIVAVVVLIFVVAIFLATGNLTQAEIFVVPKTVEISVDGEFTAWRSELADSGLVFDMVSLPEKTVTRPVEVVGVEQVEQKASGQIIIYNNFSNEDQALVAQTRFEAPGGKLYRIQKPVVVPGIYKKDGKNLPGSLEATVFADKAGEEYNIGLADFTVPGFAGSQRFSKFYARSKTPMTGGEIGYRKQINPEAEKKARADMRQELWDKLTNDAQAGLPDGFVFYDDAVFFDFSDTTNFAARDGNDPEPLELKETGTFHSLVFSGPELTRAILEKGGVETSPDLLRATNLGRLTFTLNNKDEINPQKSEKISFKLSGTVMAEMKIDEEALVAKLLGQKEEDVTELVKDIPEIKEIRVDLSPGWSSRLPRLSEKVKVTVERADA